MARREMSYNLKNQRLTFQGVSVRLQEIDIYSRGVISLCELRLYIFLKMFRVMFIMVKVAYH